MENQKIKIGTKFLFQQGDKQKEVVEITEIFGNPDNPMENPKQTVRITSKSYKDYTMYLSTLIAVNKRLSF